MATSSPTGRGAESGGDGRGIKAWEGAGGMASDEHKQDTHFVPGQACRRLSPAVAVDRCNAARETSIVPGGSCLKQPRARVVGSWQMLHQHSTFFPGGATCGNVVSNVVSAPYADAITLDICISALVSLYMNRRR